MEIYLHTGIIENPAPLINRLEKRYFLQQKEDRRFPGYVCYVNPQGIEVNINSRYIRLADNCPFDVIDGKQAVPASSPLRPVLEDLLCQFGSTRRIVNVVQEPVALAWRQ